MKVFLSTDLEGTAGVVDWEQCRYGGAGYETAVELLTGEINAAIEGATQGGATEFLVNDSHGRMANLRPDRLAGLASYLAGRFKPMYMMQGLDASFDAVFFISYHGSRSTSSVLSHTYYPGAIAEVRLNGDVTGEAGINALVAQAYGVPVALVSGDDLTVEETRRFCPGILGAAVKTSVSRFAARSLHPLAARQLIHDQAREAICRLPALSPPAVSLPARLELAFTTTDYADLACRVAGVTRCGPTTALVRGDDPLEVYRDFVTVVLLCRGLVE